VTGTVDQTASISALSGTSFEEDEAGLSSQLAVGVGTDFCHMWIGQRFHQLLD
jgi:hypothetical protein